MQIGKENHTYTVIDNWAKLPEGVALGYTHGIVIDSQDRVLVFNQSKDAVIIFDKAGIFLNSWGDDFAAGAHGMFLSQEKGEEYLYLTDLERHIVVKTTLDGKVIWELGVPDLPESYSTQEQYQPTDVAVAPNGDFYVCDGYGENWVHHYSADAKYIRSWGGKGSEVGKLDCPHGVWVDTRGDEPILLVADRGNRRIQTFTLEGKPLSLIDDDLRMPCCFFQHKDEIYIPDLLARVTIFDKENKLVTHLGDNIDVCKQDGWPNIPEHYLRPGKFVAPHALCVDNNGDIYVVEWYEKGRITKLQKEIS